MVGVCHINICYGMVDARDSIQNHYGNQETTIGILFDRIVGTLAQRFSNLFQMGPLLLVGMFYGPPYSCPL
jgi:hypothetical protein